MTFNNSAHPQIKIGYAEDHTIFRRALSALVDGFSNCRVIYDASDGRELIDKIERANDPPDICILDIYMKGLNGLDTLIELRKKWENIGILILSSSNSGYMFEMMIKSGANGFLVKDCEPIELETALRSIYTDGFYNPKGTANRIFADVMNNKSKFPEFTTNEVALLQHSCSRMSYDEIGTKMGKTTRSVDGYRNSLFKKLGAANRAELVMFAVQTGVVQLSIDTSGHFVRVKNKK